MARLEGTRLGDYDLFERIGGGGMAEVYRAKQRTAFGREVALKVIRPGLSEDEKFRGRFLREAQSISRLSHPNILPLIEFGEEHETLYLVMPLVREGTLRDLLRQRDGPPGLEEAIPLFTQLCAAVQYAHENGIVHRDIKPQNILLQQRAHVLLTDFGIARDNKETRITAEGAGLGTVEYMAPEQAVGRADKRSDIYSLGVVLYQLLTGVVPYSGSTPLQVLLKRANEPLPDPRTLNPSLSVQMVQILQTALAQDPAHRFQSALALSRAVQQVLPDIGSAKLPSAPIWPPASGSFQQPRASGAPPAPSFSTRLDAYAGSGSAPAQPAAPGAPPVGVSNYGPPPVGTVNPFSQPGGGYTPPVPGIAHPGAGMPPPTRRRPTVLIAAIALVVLLVLVMGSLLAAGFAGSGPFSILRIKPAPTTRPTPTATPQVPAGFKLYVNSDHTFRVDYPASWSASAYNIAGTGEKFEGPDGRTIIVSNAGPHQPQDAGKNADSFCVTFSFTGQINAHKNVTLAGQTWIREECDNPVTQSHGIVSTIVYKGNLYIVSYAAPQSTFASDNSRYFAQVDQSFMFLV